MTRLQAGPAALAILFLSCCTGDVPQARRHQSQVADEPPGAGEWFVDKAGESGLDFVHFNGMSGRFYPPEMMGSGAALIDYDNDGDLDVFVLQGQMLGRDRTLRDAIIPPKAQIPLQARLYRNDLTTNSDGSRTVHFTDVTGASRIQANGYGMGVAAGDFNNDGCVDLYIANFGRNQMFKNNCDGTFTDVSKATGTDDVGWSVSASFVDYDRDGWLDLFVCHYLNVNLDASPGCFNPSGARDYCLPQAFRAQPSHLYHNNHDGTFTDVTAQAGLLHEFGPALGVVAADFNGDGWPDIYVANDTEENQLWTNQHDGTFKNTALIAGVALPLHGKAEASMGVDAGDFDNDGDEDLFMAELTGQGSNLYVNDGTGTFEDRSAASGIEAASLPYTGFGAAWLDVDNDGWLDLLTVNGTVQAIEALLAAHDPFPLRQRRQLLRNLGNGRFEDATSRAGAVMSLAEVGRGAAFGDIDNDGDIDVLVNNNSGPARLLINTIGNRKHWIGLRVLGNPVRRDMLGARVSVTSSSGRTLWRRARSDGSYASSNDPRVLVGLGEVGGVVRVRVQWPDGRSEEWTGIKTDQYTTLWEGSGR